MTTTSVICPTCGAPAGYPCNAPAEGHYLTEPHPERVLKVEFMVCLDGGAVLTTHLRERAMADATRLRLDPDNDDALVSIVLVRPEEADR